MIYDLWDVFQHGKIAAASGAAEDAKRDARHADTRLHAEVLRLESKIDGLALICQALLRSCGTRAELRRTRSTRE